MYQNYLLTVWRNIIKNKMLSTINILGLALGLAATVLIGVYVAYEVSYNKWLPNIDQLYKVEFTETEPGHTPIASAMTPAPLAAALVKDFPNIEAATRLKSKLLPVYQQAHPFQEEVFFVDPNFFDIFDLNVLEGNRDAVLRTTDTVAISTKMAEKYFGDRSPIGELLTFDINTDRQVVAVFKEFPENSHFRPNFIMRVEEQETGLLYFKNSWGSDQVHTYVKTNENFDVSNFSSKGRDFVARNISLTWTKLPPEDLHHYNIIPVADIYLHSDKDNHEGPTKDYTMVVVFAGVAGLILVLAFINFTNLSTAQALKRAKEVGLRKVLGASRMQLVRQFLGEAIFTAMLAMVIGLTMVEFLLPVFSNFLDKELSMAPLMNAQGFSILLGLVVVTGFSGGLYPAFVLSHFRPSTVLHANQSRAKGPPWLQSLLVTLQFAISIGLIAATSIIYYQVEYIKDINLGFDPEGKIIIPASDKSVAPVASILKDKFRSIPGVKNMSWVSMSLPGNPHGLGVFIPPKGNSDDARSITHISVDADFFPLMKQKPLAGRTFSATRSIDFRVQPENKKLPITRGAVINLSAAKLLGFDSVESAVNQELISPSPIQDIVVTIVGVVPDMHFGSLLKTVEPVVYFVSDAPLGYLLVDMDRDNEAASITQLQTVWRTLLPSVPFRPVMLKGAYEDLYLDSERQGTVFVGFSVFAVLIACLGLYGLASFTIRNRTKEIGIRKVLGARVADIVRLLIGQFSKPVLLSNLIAWPLVVLGMSRWLETFSYRIDHWYLVFLCLIAGFLALLIAWITVGGHAIQAARNNPIRALRSE